MMTSHRRGAGGPGVVIAGGRARVLRANTGVVGVGMDWKGRNWKTCKETKVLPED